MRKYREYSAWLNGVRTGPVNPSAVSAVTMTLASVAVETLSPTNEATGRYYVTTTNPLYVSGTAYLIAWTATIGGFTFTRTIRYVHYTPTTADVIPPGAPTIATPTVTDTTATFPHTAPTDADYDHTTIVLIDGAGNTITGSGSGATITISGLTGSTAYTAIATAYDASGNPSATGLASSVSFATLQTTPPTHPLWVKWWKNEHDDQHERSPVPIDPGLPGSHRIGGIPGPGLARARWLRVRLECHAPALLVSVSSLGFLVHRRPSMPKGLRTPRGD